MARVLRWGTSDVFSPFFCGFFDSPIWFTTPYGHFILPLCFWILYLGGGVDRYGLDSIACNIQPDCPTWLSTYIPRCLHWSYGKLGRGFASRPDCGCHDWTCCAFCVVFPRSRDWIWPVHVTFCPFFPDVSIRVMWHRHYITSSTASFVARCLSDKSKGALSHIITLPIERHHDTRNNIQKNAKGGKWCHSSPQLDSWRSIFTGELFAWKSFSNIWTLFSTQGKCFLSSLFMGAGCPQDLEFGFDFFSLHLSLDSTWKIGF